MKNSISTILILCLAIFSISCSTSDDAPAAPPPSILGKWEYQKAETKLPADNSIVSIIVFNPLSNCVRNYLLIKDNNTLDQVQHAAPCAASTQNFNYTLGNNTITYGTVERKIELLTATDLVISYPTAQFRTYYTYKRAQ